MAMKKTKTELKAEIKLQEAHKWLESMASSNPIRKDIELLLNEKFTQGFTRAYETVQRQNDKDLAIGRAIRELVYEITRPEDY